MNPFTRHTRIDTARLVANTEIRRHCRDFGVAPFAADLINEGLSPSDALKRLIEIEDKLKSETERTKNHGKQNSNPER
jgi:hypothetical protein